MHCNYTRGKGEGQMEWHWEFISVYKLLGDIGPEKLQNWEFVKYLLSFSLLPFSALLIVSAGGDAGGSGEETL